jgi:HSP20 family protein
MARRKRSFFEKLTGSVHLDDEEDEIEDETETSSEENNGEGQLSVDVYQTETHIIIHSMIAGVPNQNLDISIAREMVTIKGHREPPEDAVGEDYYIRELYWGAFSRSIVLPQEIEIEEAEATESHGLLTIKLPKLDKGKQATLKVKSVS